MSCGSLSLGRADLDANDNRLSLAPLSATVEASAIALRNHALQAAFAGMGSYIPPYGSVDVPNPRSVLDILLRSAVIHLFATIAYANLLLLLPSMIYATLPEHRSGHHASLSRVFLGPNRYHFAVRLALFALLPPFFLLGQLLLRVVRPLILRHVTVHDLFSIRRPVSFSSWLLHSLTTLFSTLLLYRAFRGYSTRLSMRYHAGSYLGNLGIDHSNGWVAMAGLLAATISGLLLLWQAIVMVRAGALESNDDFEKDRQEEESEAEGMSGWTSTWAPLGDAGLAALALNPVLLRTNHLTPLEVAASHWPILLLSIGMAYALSRYKNWRWQVATKTLTGVFILATICMKVAWDSWEFWDAAHGQVQSKFILLFPCGFSFALEHHVASLACYPSLYCLPVP